MISWTKILIIKKCFCCLRTLKKKFLWSHSRWGSLQTLRWFVQAPTLSRPSGTLVLQSKQKSKPSCWHVLSTKSNWRKYIVFSLIINCIRVKHNMKLNKQMEHRLRRPRFSHRCCLSCRTRPLIPKWIQEGWEKIKPWKNHQISGIILTNGKWQGRCSVHAQVKESFYQSAMLQKQAFFLVSLFGKLYQKICILTFFSFEGNFFSYRFQI